MAVAPHLNLIPTDTLSEIATYLHISALPSFLASSSSLSACMSDHTWRCCAEAAFGAQFFEVLYDTSDQCCKPVVIGADGISWKERLKKRVLLSSYNVSAATAWPRFALRCTDPGCLHEYALVVVTELPDYTTWPPTLSPRTFVATSERYVDGTIRFETNEIAVPSIPLDLFVDGSPTCMAARVEIESVIDKRKESQELKESDEEPVTFDCIMNRLFYYHAMALAGDEPFLCGNEECTDHHVPTERLINMMREYLPSFLPWSAECCRGLATAEVFALDRHSGKMIRIDGVDISREEDQGFTFYTEDVTIQQEQEPPLEAYFLGICPDSFTPHVNGEITNNFVFAVEMLHYDEDEDEREEIDAASARKFFDALFD
jgi:hypothetical protein